MTSTTTPGLKISSTASRKTPRSPYTQKPISTAKAKSSNGRSLGLAYGEDQYRALTQRELLEEECARNYDKNYDDVHRGNFADVDVDRFAEEIENAIDNYTTEILKQLHDKFVDIYDTDCVDGLVGFIQVPAIVESLQTGNYYPALVKEAGWRLLCFDRAF